MNEDKIGTQTFGCVVVALPFSAFLEVNVHAMYINLPTKVCIIACLCPNLVSVIFFAILI